MSHAPDEEVLSAIAQFGVSASAITLLSPLGSRKGRRLAYRVDGHCGTRLKARRFESAAIAAQIMSLRAPLPPAFAPVIGRFGTVLIEQWVQGRELCNQDDAFAFSRAGAILGKLHHDFAGLGQEATSARPWLDAACSDIRTLENAGVVSPHQAAALREAIAYTAPRACRTSLIHYDFCGENMLIDDRGDLRIIDNEQLTIAPTGLEIAWTCFRWPGAGQSSLFRERYEAHAGAIPAAMDFWRTVALLTGTRVYLECAHERLDDTARQLLACIDGAPDDQWQA